MHRKRAVCARQRGFRARQAAAAVGMARPAEAGGPASEVEKDFKWDKSPCRFCGVGCGILVATKNSAGVWSAFTRVTGRMADASGNIRYYVRNSAAAWISVRGDVGGTLSNAVQGRWL